MTKLLSIGGNVKVREQKFSNITTTVSVCVDGHIVKRPTTKITQEKYFVVRREIVPRELDIQRDRWGWHSSLVEWKGMRCEGLGQTMDKADAEALYNVMNLEGGM